MALYKGMIFEVTGYGGNTESSRGQSGCGAIFAFTP